MTCPYCGFRFQVLAANGPIPEVAPLVCERCLEIGLLIKGQLRTITDEELAAVKRSPSWAAIQRGIEVMRGAKRRANWENN